jgi:hypothetical protein
MAMAAVNIVCVVAALGAIVGDLTFHIGWLIWVFAGAVVVGFAAQGWLIAGLAKRR